MPLAFAGSRSGLFFFFLEMLVSKWSELLSCAGSFKGEHCCGRGSEVQPSSEVQQHVAQGCSLMGGSRESWSVGEHC